MTELTETGLAKSEYFHPTLKKETYGNELMDESLLIEVIDSDREENNVGGSSTRKNKSMYSRVGKDKDIMVGKDTRN